MAIIYLIVSILCASAAIVLHKHKIAGVFSPLFLAVQVAFTIYACLNAGETSCTYFAFDSLGLIFLVVITIVAIPAYFHSLIYLGSVKRLFVRYSEGNTLARNGIFHASMMILVMSISLGFLANHAAVTWIFTEITTLSAAMLIYHKRDRLSLEGTWKYVFVCATSISLIFIGILLLSMSALHTGSSDILLYSHLMEHSDELNQFWLRMAFIFIFTGYTAKIGLFPMFTAGIDAKDKAPAPAGALLAAVLVNLGFIGIYRSWAVVSPTDVGPWCRMFMIVAALITLFVATAYMIKIRNFKRMLAYSGIENMSLVVLGICMGPAGCFAALLHLVLHSLVKSGLFFQYTQMYRLYRSKMITDMGGYFNLNPFGAVVLLFGLVSILAVPPSGLFVSEFLIFKAMIGKESWVVLTISLFLLTVLIWAFSRNILRVIFLPAEREIAPVKISPWESVTSLLLFIAAAYIGLNPPAVLVEMMTQAASIVL
ncbi:MAG: hypothetical protein HUJ92_04105 [Bacteroidales bacterium]|nr:hypothetical protein [Bacteroidales bacterium]